jgi:hypothetical protein
MRARSLFMRRFFNDDLANRSSGMWRKRQARDVDNLQHDLAGTSLLDENTTELDKQSNTCETRSSLDCRAQVLGKTRGFSCDSLDELSWR